MSHLLKKTLQSNAAKTNGHQSPPNLKNANGKRPLPGGSGISSGKASPQPSKVSAQSNKPSPRPNPVSSVPWPASVPMPGTSTPSFSTSIASTPVDKEIEEVPGPKKKKPRVKQDIVYSQPADTGIGTQLNTQLVYVVKRLKDNINPMRLDDLSLLSGVPLSSNAELRDKFHSHPKVIHDPKTNLYRYKPEFDIQNKEQLLTEIRRHHKKGGGMAIKTVKESWPNAGPAIEELVERGDVLVTRTAKDGQLRMVFFNEVTPSMGGGPIEKEFQDLWHGQSVPEDDIIIRDLANSGQQAADAEPSTKHIGPSKKKKGKGTVKVNRRVKITNTHLNKVVAGIDLTKDYVPAPAPSR